MKAPVPRAITGFAALVVTAPVQPLTLFMQKEIVAGLTAGGVKT